MFNSNVGELMRPTHYIYYSHLVPIILADAFPYAAVYPIGREGKTITLFIKGMKRITGIEPTEVIDIGAMSLNFSNDSEVEGLTEAQLNEVVDALLAVDTAAEMQFSKVQTSYIFNTRMPQIASEVTEA
tara:strand:- start:288 stop:674 length:387 start_codon:yes stop_codon:yes gene_type:complete